MPATDIDTTPETEDPQDRGDDLTTDQSEDEEKPESEESTSEQSEEGEETEEERAAREAEEAEAEKRKRIRIPKHRVDEMVGKERARAQALAEELAQLKAAQRNAAQSVDLQAMQQQIDELGDKYEDLIMEGEKDKARQVRKQLQALQAQYNDAFVSTRAEAVRRDTVSNMKYEQTLDKLEAKYPALDANSDQFDQAKTEEVADLMAAFQSRGMSKPDALTKAVKYVFRDEVAAAPTPDARAAEARKRAADANKRQPPATAGVGKPSDAAGLRADGVDVRSMSQKTFDSLSEEQLARLRGDDL